MKPTDDRWGTPHDLASPFIRPWSGWMDDGVVDAAVELLRHVGLEGLTLGAVGRWQGVSTQAIHQRVGSRAAFVSLVVTLYSERWRQWAVAAGAVLRLPATEEELHGARIWRLLDELVRSQSLAGDAEPAARHAAHLESLRGYVRWTLGRRLGREPTDIELDTLLALVDGLHVGLTRLAAPLELPQAHAVLEGYLSSLD